MSWENAMDINVLIAIIGMVAAVITSIISLIAALQIAKRTEKANQNLERLRLDQEQVKFLLGIKNETFEDNLKALEEACVLLQKTRDEIRTCLPKIGQGCQEKDIKPSMDSCKNLISFFQNKHFQLTPEHRKRLRELEYHAVDARMTLQSAVHNDSPEKNEKIIASLKSYVDSLRETHSEFLAYRDDMIATIGTTSLRKTG